MDVYMIILRLIHIFSGVFWIGTIWFFALFFLPRIHAFGPEGGRLMQRFTAPPLPTVMSLAGGLVALSGVLMYWKDSAGFDAAWIGTPAGLALTIGGVAGLFASAEGLFVSRPTAERLGALGRQVEGAGGPPSPTQMGEMQTLAATLERAVYRTAYFGVVALLAMATARYL